ncbi:unnamed protein product [Calypogeia fissa]
MAVAIARHGIASLSSSRRPGITSLSGRAATDSSFFPSTASVGTASRKIAAPLLFVFSPIHVRAQLVTSPRDRQVRGTSSSTSSRRGCFDDAVALLASAPVLPKLVVLDLDFTVWPFYCWFFQSLELLPGLSFAVDAAPSIEDFFAIECFLPRPSGAVDDFDNLILSAQQWAAGQLSGHGDPPKVYSDVVDIVKALAAQKVEMAIASRTPSASVAKTFLEKLSINHYFPSKEIYFTIYSKTKHFTALNEKTGIPYNSMLFFDDELKNIVAASRLGVTGIVVREGLDLKSLEKGLNAFASRN